MSIVSDLKLKALLETNPIVREYKRKAKILLKDLKKQHVNLAKCQNLVAQQYQYNNWHHFIQTIKNQYAREQYDKEFGSKTISTTDFISPVPNSLYLGLNAFTKKHEWIKNNIVRNHLLLLGSNEVAQKLDEQMINQAMLQSKNLFYMDGTGKADNIDKIIAIAKKNNRGQDIKIISAIPENRGKYKIYRHSLNQNFYGKFDTIASLFTNLIDEDNESDSVWKGRAISLLISLLMCLCELRDKQFLNLNIKTIQHYLLLENLIILSKNKNLTNTSIQSLQAYLRSIPGYQEGSSKQESMPFVQHSFLQIQYTKIFILIENHPEIFQNKLEPNSDSNFDLLSNKIYLVQLPSHKVPNSDSLIISKFIFGLFKNDLFQSFSGEETLFRRDNFEQPSEHQKRKMSIFIKNSALYNNLSLSPLLAQSRAFGINFHFSYSNEETIIKLNGHQNSKIINQVPDTKIVTENKDYNNQDGVPSKLLHKDLLQLNEYQILLNGENYKMIYKV